MQVEVEVYNDDGTLFKVLTYPVKDIHSNMVFVDEGPNAEAAYCLGKGKDEGQFYCGIDPRWKLSAKSLAECRAVMAERRGRAGLPAGDPTGNAPPT
jgi:hypothetical protein